MRSKNWNKILIAAMMVTPIPYVAYAEVYLSENQAAMIFFPDLKLEPCWMDLTSQEMKTITKVSGEKVVSPRVRVWWGTDRQALIIDRVLGKHELITYAVAINPDSKIKGIEILEYRETYGYQIKEPQWRKKFVGKSIADPLKLDKDIPNISGATLSSAHVTNGVRRILHTYEILKSKI